MPPPVDARNWALADGRWIEQLNVRFWWKAGPVRFGVAVRRKLTSIQLNATATRSTGGLRASGSSTRCLGSPGRLMRRRAVSGLAASGRVKPLSGRPGGTDGPAGAAAREACGEAGQPY
jgi:hypothetical protein